MVCAKSPNYTGSRTRGYNMADFFSKMMKMFLYSMVVFIDVVFLQVVGCSE